MLTHDAMAGCELEPLPTASSSPPCARSQGIWVLGLFPLTSLCVPWMPDLANKDKYLCLGVFLQGSG